MGPGRGSQNDRLWLERATWQTGTRALIEKLLLAEYETALAEFDRVKEQPDAEPGIHVCVKRYIEATARVRKFLAYGEVPRDIVERLNEIRSNETALIRVTAHRAQKDRRSVAN